MRTKNKLFLRSWTAGVGLFLALASPSVASEEEIRHSIAQLLDEEVTVRATAIEALARTRDPRVTQLLAAFQEGSLYEWNDTLVFCPQMTTSEDGQKSAPLFDPLTRQRLDTDGKPLVAPSAGLRELGPTRRERRAVRDGLLLLRLFSAVPEERLASIQKCGDLRDLKFLESLEELSSSETNADAQYTIRESICLIRLGGKIPDQELEDRLAAARELGEMRSARGLPLLEERLQELDAAAPEGTPVNPVASAVYRQAVEEIQSYRKYVHGFEHLFSGLSLGSILILMALGLSITFGLMGVINMAHGELMMIGAYATYEMQRLFDLLVVEQWLPESAFNWYYVLALPVAFFSAALVGYFVERLVIRHLYGRPLETLLATWGVGLILIQGVRLLYGDNIGVNSPTWLRGGAEVLPQFILPYNRCFIIFLCVLCVALIYSLLNFTKLGLMVRATMQNRAMADSLGVNTRRIDAYTFALGSGLAGIAGYALTLVGGVTPDMGQNYIVDSFLVVVTGGVGEIAGAVCAGLGLGVLNKLLEPQFEAVWAKVLILVCVVLFVQWRPSGLFPPKGRLADA